MQRALVGKMCVIDSLINVSDSGNIGWIQTVAIFPLSKKGYYNLNKLAEQATTSPKQEFRHTEKSTNLWQS